MAEIIGILGLIGSVIAILEGVNETRIIFKKHVHKSSSLQKELIPILGKLTAFTGILRGLQLECELDEFDPARLHAFEHIRAPLEASERAAKAIMARLNDAVNIGAVSLTFGKVLNKKTTAALHVLEQAKEVLDLALDADQRLVHTFSLFPLCSDLSPILAEPCLKPLRNISELWQKIFETWRSRKKSITMT
jgi:hypothetical protein